MHQPASQCAEKEDAVEPDDGAAEAWLSNHGDDDDSHAWLPEVADPLPDVGPPAMASEKPNSERNAELIPGKAIPTLAEGVNDDSSIEAPTVSTTMPNDNNPSQPLELRDIDSKHGESADPCSANHVDDDADAWLAIEDANTHEDVAPQAHQEPASNEDGDAWLSKENDDDVDDELLAPEEEPASQTIEGPTAVDHNEDDKKAWFEDEDEQAGTGPLVSEGQAPQTTQSLVRDGDIGASHANDKVELAESLLASDTIAAQATKARPAQETEARAVQVTEAIEALTDQATEAPTDQATEAPTDQAAEERPAQAIEAPATQPIEAPTTQAIEATPTRASEARPSQATEARPVQAIEAPIAQATEARSAKPTEETPAQPTEETSAQPTKETPAQPTKETPAQPTEETSAQPTKETPAQPAEARSAQATEARPSQATKAIPVQTKWELEMIMSTMPYRLQRNMRLERSRLRSKMEMMLGFPEMKMSTSMLAGWLRRIKHRSRMRTRIKMRG
ncbi:hypothetical protein RJ55_05486 [Drechmeria coniospora]|nr:hypothetical protein RJ55_05486 [Drechmeria coniospora]